jgi:hypothetical protein
VTIRRVLVALAALIALAACGGGDGGSDEPKVVKATMPIDQSVVDYTTEHGDAPFKAKAKEVCDDEDADQVDLTVAPTDNGPEVTFSYDCTKL